MIADCVSMSCRALMLDCNVDDCWNGMAYWHVLYYMYFSFYTILLFKNQLWCCKLRVFQSQSAISFSLYMILVLFSDIYVCSGHSFWIYQLHLIPTILFGITLSCSLFMVKSATVNPKVLLELFSMYRDWQEERVEEISKKQVCKIQE